MIATAGNRSAIVPSTGAARKRRRGVEIERRQMDIARDALKIDVWQILRQPIAERFPALLPTAQLHIETFGARAGRCVTHGQIVGQLPQRRRIAKRRGQPILRKPVC